jgi:hypothetical protein
MIIYVCWRRAGLGVSKQKLKPMIRHTITCINLSILFPLGHRAGFQANNQILCKVIYSIFDVTASLRDGG